MDYKTERIGETRVMNCGMKATIIEYRKARDIDVKFEDGQIRERVEWRNFISGAIAHPDQAYVFDGTTRIGETKIMNNGLSATIIAYRSATDIDVKFEDGTIVLNKTYGSFADGEISHPNPIYKTKIMQRLHETKMMACGLMATVVGYRNAEDVDVEFENGYVLNCTSYYLFEKGSLSTPERSKKLWSKRINEKRTMKDGHEAQIIAYRGACDIDIKFDTGEVQCNKTYRSFLAGGLRVSKEKKEKQAQKQKVESLKAERIGETLTMNNGLAAIVIAYRTANDIDVRFEDGVVVKNKAYSSFKNGHIAHPTKKTSSTAKRIRPVKDRLGEVNTMGNGMSAKIVAYRSSNDISVEFEDGVIVEHVRYGNFNQGTVSHPNIKYMQANSIQEYAIRYYLSQLGFRKVEQGEWSRRGFGKQELDFYHDEKRVAIEFDGGLHIGEDSIARDIKKNKKCKKLGIVLYRIRVSRLPILNDKNSINYVLNEKKKVRVGLLDCKEELISILDAHNIPHDHVDIDFYRDVDAIMNEYNSKFINYYENKRVGEIVYNPTVNQNMKIIAYRSAKDIDVQFEDGSIRHSVAYKDFVDGGLQHISQTTAAMAGQRIGETRTMNNGKKATIVEYRMNEDIDVMFDDGKIRYNVTYDHFKVGKVGHPDTLRGDGARHRLGETRTMHCGLKATIIAYRKADDIDVKFETGEIRCNVSYYSFNKEALLPKNRLRGKE